MALTDRAPTGLVRTRLRAPIRCYRAGLGALFGHRLPAETAAVLRGYRLAHPRAWAQIAPRLGFPASADDPRWPEVAASVHAVAFAPATAG
jgi:hypothetical protein